MDTVDIIGLLVPVTYFIFLVTEKIWPARTFPPRKGWQLIGIAFDLRIQRSVPQLYHRILCALIGVRIRQIGQVELPDVDHGLGHRREDRLRRRGCARLLPMDQTHLTVPPAARGKPTVVPG